MRRPVQLVPPGDDAAISEFDAFAATYDAALQAGLTLTGEGKDYFAKERVLLLRKRLDELGHRVDRALDFGCGTGSGVPFLLTDLDARTVVGVDVSAASLEIARARHSSQRASFITPEDLPGAGDFDLAFCNGVFHHIAVDKRLEAVRLVYRALRPGGVFALWENNPWNPGTRLIMRRVVFDHDAVTLTSGEARALLRAGGFDVICTDFRFYFPRPLHWFRALEHALVKLPLGGQFQVLARKPASEPNTAQGPRLLST